MKMLRYKDVNDNSIAVNPKLVTAIEKCPIDNTTKIYFTGGENDYIRVAETFKEVYYDLTGGKVIHD